MIHSTCLSQSGGAVEDVVGGGASSAFSNREYVTSIDLSMLSRAGLRSVMQDVGIMVSVSDHVVDGR